MKRTFWLSMLVALSAASVCLQAGAQVAPEAGPAPAPPKYEAYVGFAYTSLNQVNLSRHGLMGGEVSLNRDWGKYFALRAAGDYYKVPTGTLNPGNPSVYSILAGPEIHANVWGNLDGLMFGELGMEHTGGENMSPSSSVAGGLGGGIRYRFNQRLALRIMGDRVWGSFSLNNNSQQLGYSSHRTANARATIGVSYRF